LGIYEVLQITETIRKIIVSPNFDLDKLRQQATDEGMVSMFEDGFKKAALGATSIDEIMRVIRE
jgi:type II secretory ATPase GspE/PulE/Tfp pilus assembly ATPase PilB-like protein